MRDEDDTVDLGATSSSRIRGICDSMWSGGLKLNPLKSAKRPLTAAGVIAPGL